MNRETAMRKLQACLRLAASSNPNEAAAALRQARKLMNAYGLTEDDAATSEIHFQEAPTKQRGADVRQSVIQLAHVVGAGFRCKVLIVQRWFETKISFFGAGPDAEVAAYAFTVLRRQMDRDRIRHTRRIRKRLNKDRRGESFAQGWVRGVMDRFPEAEMPEGREVAITRKMDSYAPDSKLTSGRETGAVTYNDMHDGHAAGKNAQLHNGVPLQQRQLEHAS